MPLRSTSSRIAAHSLVKLCAKMLTIHVVQAHSSIPPSLQDSMAGILLTHSKVVLTGFAWAGKTEIFT